MVSISMALQSGVLFFMDVALKSVILLVGAWALALGLRRASAAARHWIWSLAMAGLLVLPVLSFVVPEWRIGLLPQPVVESVTEPAASAPSTDLVAPASRSIHFDRELTSPVSGASAASPRSESVARPLDWVRPVFAIWMLGLGLIVIHMLGAIFKVRHLARQASPITDGAWVSMARHLAARLRLRARVALLRTGKVTVPMTWGALRSVVMLPEEAESWSEECRRIVLLHELAHIKRRDCLTQNLAQLACAIYWFNPLVWVAARQLRVERELACDDQVLEVGTKASDYAGHLVEIARSYRMNRDLSAVTVGMACSQLESRVRSILDPGIRRRGLNRWGAVLIGAGAAGLLFCLAAVKPWGGGTVSFNANVEAAQAVNVVTPLRAAASFPQSEPPASPATTRGEKRSAAEKPEAPEEASSLEPTEADSQSASQAGVAKGQRSELTVDQIVEMKTHGVTPEFIESIRRAGFDNLTADELIRLRIHGVSPEYVESLRRNGFDKLTADQIASLKIHGIDEAFIRETQNWTGGKREINELLQLRIHGVTPEFARSFKALGFGDLSVEKLTAMKIHGVSEAYIKEMRDLGFDKLTAEQLMRMRIHGITAEYVKKMRAAGLKNVSVDQMIDMKIRGIDSILLKGK